MGFFDKLLGKDDNMFPELDASSHIAQRIDRFRNKLEELASEVQDPLEVIPSDDAAYVFIGKPPKKFGIAWIKDGRICNFKTLAQEKGVHEMKLMMMSEELRKAYENNERADRFSTNLGNQKVVVTDSEAFLQELRQIIP